MKISILSTCNSRNSGGLFDAVRCLALAIYHNNNDIKLFSYDDNNSVKDKPLYEDLPLVIYKVLKLPLFRTLGYSLDLLKLIYEYRPDIIHTEGLWMYNSWASVKYKKKNSNVKTIISPHGMLDPWAIKNSAWKKKIVGWLFEYKNLEMANCIHALCKSEYDSIRALGLKNPVAIIPNGIDIPDILSFNRSNDKKILLYIGRIHPKKGLKELLLGLKILKDANSKFFKQWKVRIAGWNQVGYLEKLQRIVVENEMQEYIEFIGPVFGKDKERELSSATAFILPSFSEGLPMSALEAWSYRLPLIMTDYCNLPEGFNTNSAIHIEPSPGSIAEGLLQLYEMTNTQLEELGNNGYALVKEKFSWEHVAKQTMQLYEWILNGGEKPEFVYE